MSYKNPSIFLPIALSISINLLGILQKESPSFVEVFSTMDGLSFWFLVLSVSTHSLFVLPALPIQRIGSDTLCQFCCQSKSLTKGRVRMNGQRYVLSNCTHLKGQHCFRDKFPCILSADSSP